MSLSITLRYITIHYNTVQYITLHYITIHYNTLHYIHYITLLSLNNGIKLFLKKNFNCYQSLIVRLLLI
jgi:hypothetical protein